MIFVHNSKASVRVIRSDSVKIVNYVKYKKPS